MSDPRGASRVERAEYIAEQRAQHADDLAEARAEQRAERMWDDDPDDYYLRRAESRYEDAMLGRGL